MSDERIEVQVKDEVATTIATKLDTIAKKAREGYSAIDRMKAALRAIGIGNLDQLTAANNRAQRAFDASVLAAQRLATEQQRTAQATLQAANAQNILTANQIKSATVVQKAMADQRIAAASLVAAKTRLATEEQRLATAAAKTAAVQAQAAVSTQRLVTEQQRSSTAALAAATAQQRLQTAATQTAVAQQGVAAATARATTAQNQAAQAASNAAAAQSRAAAAALRLQQAQSRANASQQNMARDAERLKRELFPLYAAQQQFNEALDRANTLLKAGAIDQKTYYAAVLQSKNALLQTTNATNGFSNAQTKMGRNAQINRAHLANLSFQLNDIAVSLASGQNPLLVLVQQGSQIAGIATQAGVSLSRLAAAAGRMLLPFLPLVAVFGTLVGGIKLLASEANKGANLEKFAKGLGASDKEIKKLNLDTVTFGDSLRGLWATIDDATGINNGLKKIGGWFVTAFKTILNTVANVFVSIVSLGSATVDTLIEAWQTFHDRFGLTIFRASNFAIDAFEKFVNFSIKGINVVIDGLNKISPANIPNIAEIALGRNDTSVFKESAVSLVDTFVNSYMENMESRTKAINDFIAKWQSNSVKAAQDRIRKATRDETAEESRATALAKINAQLDNERDRMFKLRPEREAQAKFDQIEETLLGKKIKLTQTEAAAIRAKIDANQAGLIVQAQFDAIYTSGTAALETYNAVLAASAKLVREQPQLQDAAARAVVIAREAYENSIDPLRQINIEIDKQNALLALNPRQREVAQQMQQVENQLLAIGIILTKEQTAALQGRYEAQQQMNIASQAEAAIFEATKGARETYIAQLTAIAKLKADGTINKGQAAQQVIGANPQLNFEGTQTGEAARVQQYADMYKQVNDLRAQDLISEQTASQVRLKIWTDEQSAKLRNAQTFFGDVSSLSANGNKKMFKIGQAAAIANATIQGQVAIANALATPPWYTGVLLSIAAAAKTYQTIQTIKSQKPPGYMRGGYTGGSSAFEERGPAHGREFIFDAAATAAIGKENLERMRNTGTAGPVGSGIKISIANYGTSKKFDVKQISAGEVRLIAQDEAERAVATKTGEVVAAQIAEPNSRTSKALRDHTTAGRRR